jgi:ubiquitin-activating enzyme E1
MNEFCRANGIAFIKVDTAGVFGEVFVDLGPEFVVVDANGEEPQEVMLEHITTEEAAEVTLLKNTRHDLQDGDLVRFHSIEGMEGLNDQTMPVTVINPQKFRIGDTRGLGEYIRGGLAKQVK